MILPAATVLCLLHGAPPLSGAGKLLFAHVIKGAETGGFQGVGGYGHYPFGNEFLQQFKLDKCNPGKVFDGLNQNETAMTRARAWRAPAKHGQGGARRVSMMRRDAHAGERIRVEHGAKEERTRLRARYQRSDAWDAGQGAA
jgi:hypothetical protein